MVHLYDLLQDEKVIVFEEVVVGVPRLGGGSMSYRGEFVKDASRRLGSIVEEEHDPRVHEQTTLGRQDDCSFVIGIVVHKVSKSCQDLRCLVRGEDIVAAPDFADRMRLHGIRGDDSKIVATTLEGREEIYEMVRCWSSMILYVG